MKKWNVVLRLSSKSIPQKIDQARFVVESMENNKELFPEPKPALKDITRISNELQAAYTTSRDAGKEQTAKMYTIEFELEIEMIALANYVQDIANKDNDVGDVIILCAGMEIKKEKSATARTFTAENTAHEGRVMLQTKSEGRASYVWEYSLDQDNWIAGSITNVASTILNNLKAGGRYYFRVAIIKNEQGPWSDVLSLIVT